MELKFVREVNPYAISRLRETLMKRLFLAAVAVSLLGIVSPASAMPLGQAAPAIAGDNGVVLVKGGHGGGHGWGRGGRGHHYGWSRGRGHHYGWSRGRHRGWR